MKLYYAFLSALFLITHLNVYGQNKPVAILPFELKNDNRIYIKCRVNQSDTLTFLFDTGSGAMVINQSILDKKLNLVLDSETDNVGANGETKVKTSTKNKLLFGGIETDSVTLLAIPYGESAFDGVFGSNLMEKYIIEINYHKKLLYFYNIADYVYNTSGYDKFDLKFIVGVPTFPASLMVDNTQIEGTFEMDTGGDTGLLISDHFAKDHQMAQKLKQVAKAAFLGSDGIKTETAIVVVPEIIINNKHFYRVPSLLSSGQSGVLADKRLDGILGNAFLKRFDVILDIHHNQVFLKPNDLLYTPYYDFLVK